MKKDLFNIYTKEIREKMNYVIEEIQGDFTGWCELGTMLMYRIIRDMHPNIKNEVAIGYYKNEGHFWNIIDNKIIDTTIDQFDNVPPGIINEKYIKNYTIKNIITFNEDDLLEITSEVYNLLSFKIKYKK